MTATADTERICGLYEALTVLFVLDVLENWDVGVQHMKR